MRRNITILDGAMGTMLRKAGLDPQGRPELLCVTAPHVVEEIHRRYVRAGAQMILTNTFRVNARTLADTGFSVGQTVRAAVEAARRACEGTGALVALDIGPTGALMEPFGSLRAEEAYGLFAQVVREGVRAGADAVFFETFSDLSELRAGILAAKENCTLPVLACMTFETGGRTFLGCRADAAAMALSALGVAAVGMNCSGGPQQAAPVLRAMRTCTDLPLILKPNAGLPDPQTGAYAMEPDVFAVDCVPLADLGAAYIGGCCGTTPEYIAALKRGLAGREAVWNVKTVHGICSAGEVCAFGRGVRVVGERINPAGKKKLAQALREQNMEEVVAEAVRQAEAGAQILDVHVGLPGLDEEKTMRRAVTAISGAVSLPLQIDSNNPAAIEAGLRAAPGKCLVNSVNASAASLAAVLPVVQKYGAAVVGLTMREDGLPATAKERVDMARRIVSAALQSGIPREDVVIDCLALTAAAQQDQAAQTLEAVRRVHAELGLETMLGISNVSFGLPDRACMAKAFLAQALACGLTMPIVNPDQPGIMDMIDACRVLSGEDAGCAQYVKKHAAPGGESAPPAGLRGEEGALFAAIERGIARDAAACARTLLENEKPLELVERHILPALDAVGERYEKGRIFLPQLMHASAAAEAALDEARHALSAQGQSRLQKGTVVLATVEGDMHDIGRRIVRMLLESYGFQVADLGHNVPAQRVVEAVRKTGAGLVGLSALMTTTLPAMARTISSLRRAGLQAPVVAGGAVLTQEYAEKIGADYYAADARQTAQIARRVLGGAAPACPVNGEA